MDETASNQGALLQEPLAILLRTRGGYLIFGGTGMMMKQGWVFEDQMFLNGWVWASKMFLKGWVLTKKMFLKGSDKP